MSYPRTPDPHSRPTGPATPTTAQGRLADRRWRLRHSAWMLGPILGLGLVTWAAFLYIGFRARRWDWLVAGALYAVALGSGFYLTPTAGTPGQAGEGWGPGLVLACWAAGVVHAFLANRSWLRWRARADDTPWYERDHGGTPAAPPASPTRSSLPSPLRQAGVHTDDYYAPRPPDPHGATGDRPPSGPPPAPLPSTLPPSAPPPAAAPPRSASPHPALDVNSASGEQLATLPGFTDHRVRAVLAARTRGPFVDLQQFADAAGLAPHEHHRLRSLVTARRTTPPGSASGSGRVVDF